MKAYFFDLDGTLTDARPGLNLSFRAACRALGFAEASDRDLERFLGSPLPEAFRVLNPKISHSDIVKGMAAFRKAYETEGLAQNHIYPGVKECLRDIAHKGAINCVVTSKPEHYANRVVDDLGIRPFVKTVIGAGLDEVDTKAELIARALSATGIVAKDAIMLGDRHYDIIGALETKVLPVGALWGYGSYDELHGAGCRHFVASPHEFHDRYVKSEAGFPGADGAKPNYLQA